MKYVGPSIVGVVGGGLRFLHIELAVVVVLVCGGDFIVVGTSGGVVDEIGIAVLVYIGGGVCIALRVSFSSLLLLMAPETSANPASGHIIVVPSK